MDLMLTVHKICIVLSLKLSGVNVPNLGPRINLPLFGNFATGIFVNI